ncbi:unnamed protein product [Paramecium primaurelia]|uniref:Transmembrane protein n=1 Tax=Paramecium primaurelia TaxID=5886 RepID=A0A8S1K9N8_PARPR|nr:unnamed protein product [Paramecium primaurelia]
MYLIIFALIFILNSISTKLQSNINSTKSYLLYINEDKNLLEFPNAIDAQLYTNNSNPFCKLIQKNIAIYIKQFPILENHEIYDQVDNQVYPFDQKQFICMTQIQDGIIVLTTDFIINFFQFNYDAIQSNKNNQFAKKIWTADFKSIIQGSDLIIEFAQIVFCPSSNQVLIIFPSTAYLLRINQVKTKEQNLEVINVGDWVKRSNRGLTKSIDDFIFTCVGEYGIDIYQQASDSLRFIANLDKINLKLEQFNLKDFTLIKLNDFDYKCYFLDLNGDVYIIEIQIIKYELKFQLLTLIYSKGQGISIDTKNGINLFVAYQFSHIYYVVEYYISVNQSIYFELNSYKTRNQIKCLDATDEFVILQGNNHHKILFRSDIYQYQSDNLPVFTYLGLRDFEIFSLYSDIQQTLKGFEIFVGITSTSLFLVKFDIQPYSIRCLTNQTNLSEIQYYQFLSNTTTFIETDNHVDQIVNQTIFNFTVQFIDSEDFKFQIETYQILIGILFFILFNTFFYWIHIQKRKINDLEKQISLGQRRNRSKINNL